MSRVTPATAPPGSANLGDCQVEDVDRTDILGSPSSPVGRRPSLLDNRALRGVPVKALRAMYAGRLRDRNYVSLFI